MTHRHDNGHLGKMLLICPNTPIELKIQQVHTRPKSASTNLILCKTMINIEAYLGYMLAR